MAQSKVMQAVYETGVIAIVRGIARADMLRLADALWRGGVRLVEVTMNTQAAVESIADLAATFGDRMCIGAGTVLDATAAQMAQRAGATFLVTPHVGVDVIEYGVTQHLDVFSGAMTPTEIYTAHRCGATAVKVFPSRSLGPQYFKDVRGPFPDIPLLAVGGVSTDNAAEFLRSGAIGWGLGGGLVDKEALARGDAESISTEASQFVRIYEACRGHVNDLG